MIKQQTPKNQKNWTLEEDRVIFDAAREGLTVEGALKSLSGRTEKSLIVRARRKGFTVARGVIGF